MVVCSLLLFSQVLLLNSLCFLDALSLLSSALFLFFVEFWVPCAAWTWFFAWAWAFHVVFVAIFLLDSALWSDQSWLLVFFFLEGFWWNGDNRFLLDPVKWSLDGVDFIEHVLAKWKVGLNVGWIGRFNNDGVVRLNLNNINRWRILCPRCIINLLRPHFWRINTRLLTLGNILIGIIIGGVCLFLLRLILNSKSIVIVCPEGEEGNDKHDKDMKVVESRSEHVKECEKILEIIRKVNIKVFLVWNLFIAWFSKLSMVII